MKTFKLTLGTLLLTALLLTSCSKNDDSDLPTYTPTAQAFNNLKQDALDNETQTFQINAEDGWTNITTDHGVTLGINGNCLTLNGSAVTGAVDIEYVELFDKGNMLSTNKPTMGTMPNGDKALLISGGEFFVEATQNGQALQTTCPIQLTIPTALTGGTDNDMILWRGEIDQNGDLTWDEAPDAAGQGENGVFAEGGEYYAFFNDFGWTNVDRFYSDPRPKTTILAQAPAGYDYTNSAIYLSYDGEDSGLARLDTFENGMFSEHYGQIPIGLECHAIFVTEDNGVWRYAIKAVTIVENHVITFDYSDTDVATESELEAIINGLP